MKLSLGLTLLSFGLLGSTFACAQPVDDASSDGTSAYSADRATAPAGTPAFTASDPLSAWSTRLRLSVDGAAFAETEGASSECWDHPSANPCTTPFGIVSTHDVAGGQLDIAFGQEGDLVPVPGTYACADRDGRVGFDHWNAATVSVTRATDCVVVIQSVTARASSSAYRVEGWFSAGADAAQGLPAVRGAFVTELAARRPWTP